MSLTRHIEDKDSPVRAWFEQHLPNTGFEQFRISLDAIEPITEIDVGAGPMRISLTDWWDPKDAVVLPSDEKGYPWGGVGTAFDYRVRLLFGAPDLDMLVAARGIGRLQGLFGSNRAIRAWAELREEFDRMGDRFPRQVLDADYERRLCQLVYVLALYEQCLRGPLNPSWPIATLGADAPLDEVVALCSEHVVTDLVSLIELFCASQPTLVHASTVHLNPRFSGSIALGGADADVILDALLLDLKTTKHADPKRPELWQLAGYALADFEDEYAIERVGLYYARFGSLVSWPLNRYLDLLAGSKVNFAELRQSFASMLEDHSGIGAI
jgi:hypothetical protein